MQAYAVKMVQLSAQEVLDGVNKNALFHPSLVFANSLRKAGMRVEAQAVEERVQDCKKTKQFLDQNVADIKSLEQWAKLADDVDKLNLAILACG